MSFAIFPKLCTDHKKKFLARTYAHKHTVSLDSILTQIHMRNYSRASTHTQTHTYTLTFPLSFSLSRIHTHTHTHTNTQTHTHTLSLSLTHTHTHTHIYGSLQIFKRVSTKWIPRHSKDLSGKLINLEIQIFFCNQEN